MEKRIYGHKDGEGINFGRLGEDHVMGDLDADEFVNHIEEITRQGRAEKEEGNDEDEAEFKKAA